MVRRIVPALLALVFCAPAAAAENSDWLSYGHDNQLTNAVPSKVLTVGAARQLQARWATLLDGTVYASPLATRVGDRELVFVATEKGSVYALSATDGRIVWQRALGTVETTGCGTYGVSSTGVIDAKRGLLYVVSADGVLHGLELATGDDAAGWPRTIVTNTLWEYVWGGLRIAGDRLYVPVASYCDEGPYDETFPDGRLVSIPLEDPDATTVWEPVPGPANLGGIWGWGGVSVDPSTGNLFTGIGNSHVWSDACSCYVDDGGYGDQMVALAPDLSAVVDSDSLNLPNTVDVDFGAAPLLFQPTGCPPLAAANNKDGILYVWNRTKLSAGPIASLPLSDSVAAYVGAPSWSASTQMLYDAQSVLFGAGDRLGNGIRALRVDLACTFRGAWARVLGDGNQATPLVVGDVVFATGGDPGGFFAFRAADGAPLWSSPTAGPTVAAMISVDGMIVGADSAGLVYAFQPPPASPPPAQLPPSPWRLVGR